MSNLKEVYKETLTHVLALEAGKKDLARQMLQQRDPIERRLTIAEFLRQDQKKHKLLGQMVAEGTNRQEPEVINSISNLYGVENSDDLWSKVESHQRLNQRMLDLLEREIATPGEGDFLERRLLMEIEKQALRQAHDYMNPLQNQ
ncbi:MAG: hypothetical protein ACM3O9_07710 [Methylocystaceae bacterium]